MTCDEVRSELLAYHFGEVSPGARPLIEAHLPTCPACVTELVALKRAIELAEDAPRPSDLARARLRAAVAQAIGVSPRRWWERPVALTFAASALFAALFATISMTAPPGAPPSAAELHRDR